MNPICFLQAKSIKWLSWNILCRFICRTAEYCGSGEWSKQITKDGDDYKDDADDSCLGEWVWQGRLEAGRYLALAHTSGHNDQSQQRHRNYHDQRPDHTHFHQEYLHCTIMITPPSRCSTSKTPFKPPPGAAPCWTKPENSSFETISRSAAGHLWSSWLGQQWITIQVYCGDTILLRKVNAPFFQGRV